MKMTSLCYLEQNGRYLMLHRTKKANDENHDKWIGVGGKFESCESPEDCMRREILEETGFTVTDFRYRGIVTFVFNDSICEYMHLFTVTAWTGEQKVCDEGELAWIDKDALFSLPMWEGDRIFLRLLDSDAPFFSLKLCYREETLTQAVLNGKPISLS
ncbi:MAG: 8-oxo-dGTP diphosphatase [Ruminococcaceae bacterium]|nr:8-oxo-dGTP diphosphatase [Oscillospiraceae bacterium]